MIEIDIDHLNKWVGHEKIVEALISVETANLMKITLNREPIFNRGDGLPPAWHWLYFHEAVRGDDLGLEGHPKLGGFMPPVPLPRRMWAGGNLEFIQPLTLGETATNRSTVREITAKNGRSGQLCFVIVEHEVSVAGERRLLEKQTIVYREAAPPNSNKNVVAGPAPTGAEFSNSYTPNPIMLFRYSALTFNSHRIHYDVDYCRVDEGYPDLVVHGPLTATLLLDLFYHQFPEQDIAAFEYRGQSPLLNPHPFSVSGKATGEAWATNHEGGLAMSARVTWR